MMAALATGTRILKYADSHISGSRHRCAVENPLYRAYPFIGWIDANNQCL